MTYTNEQIEAEREAFEIWAKGEHLMLARHGAGRVYWSFDTNAAWKAWKAREKIAVKDAERYVFLRRKIAFIGNPDGTATMCALNLPISKRFPEIGEHEACIDEAIDTAIGDGNV